MKFKDGDIVVLWFKLSNGEHQIWRIFRENTNQHFNELHMEWIAVDDGLIGTSGFRASGPMSKEFHVKTLEETLECPELSDADRRWILGVI